MASDVLMPRLSDSMEEGTVLKWLVEQGGAVKRGEPLVEIETDKANMTYEADSDGVLLEVLAKEGDTLPIGQPIARLGQEGELAARPAGDDAGRESAPAAHGEGAPADHAQQPAAPVEAPAAQAPASVTATEAPPADSADANGRIKASPVARRVAGELGVELARLEGT